MAVGSVGGAGTSGAAAVARQMEAVKNLTLQLVAEPAQQAVDLSKKLVGIQVAAATDPRSANIGTALDVLA